MTTGFYSPTFGTGYQANNPYTYGQAGFTPQMRSTQITQPGGPSLGLSQRGPLIGNRGQQMAQYNNYSALGPTEKHYLDKKWGLWSGKAEDTGQKGVADTLEDINRILTYKGFKPAAHWGEVSSALQPGIAKRNAKGGLGKILGTVAPIALSFIPGLGPLASAAIGAAGGALSGGGLKGALIGGAGGFIGGGGISSLAKTAGKIGASGAISPAFGTLSKTANVLGKLGVGGSGTSTLGKLRQGLGALQQLSPQQGQQPSQGYTNEQVQQLLMQQQGGRRPSAFLQAAGRGYAKGGHVVGPGDGMSDGIPAVIGNGTPAALSDGEHVVPALQVAMLGRGSSKAGSERIAQLVKQEISKLYGKDIDPVALQTSAMQKKGK